MATKEHQPFIRKKAFIKKFKLSFFAVKWFLIAAQQRFAVTGDTDTTTVFRVQEL